MGIAIQAQQRDTGWFSSWWPGRRIVLVSLVSLVYAIVFLLNALTLLEPPHLFVVTAVSASGGVRIGWVRTGSDLWDRGIRSGDRVLALDGRRPSPHDAGIWTGQRLVVRRALGGTVTLDARALQRGHATWPLLVLSPFFFLLGTLVVLRARQPAIGRAAYALFASAAFALALAPAADGDQPLAALIEFAAVTLFAACFALFCLTYPTPRVTRRHVAVLLLVPTVAIALHLAALVWPALYGTAVLLRLAILLTYLLVGAGLLVCSFVTTTDRDARRGLAIIGLGTLVAILPFVALYLLPTLLQRSPLLASEHAIIALAILPISFTYAILRHDALDIPLLQRWLVYGLLWGLLLLPLSAMVALWPRLFAALPEPARSMVFFVALALIAGLSIGWGRERLQRRLDRLIFKDSYDYRASLLDLSRDLSLFGDLAALGQIISATLCQLMNLDFALLVVRDAHGVQLNGSAGRYQSTLLSTVHDAIDTAGDGPSTITHGALTVMLIPLRTHDALVGHLCLGPKASGEPFRAEDRALLATLSGHLAAIVHNAQLTGDLRQKVSLLAEQGAALNALNERLQRAHEEERARLAADLHDEPLQTALSLQRHLADLTARHVVSEAPSDLAHALVTQLRAICLSMRPTALDDLGLLAALDQLAREQGNRAQVPVVLDADPAIAELDLSPATELALYRAAQEAISNCLRHAQAGRVLVTLRRDADGVCLSIRDDGIGFDPPARCHDLVAAGHLGLAGLHERIQHAGGRVLITSAPRQGTSVQIHLPETGTPA